jgi:hypothetical protein
MEGLMTKETKIVPLEPGVKLGVRCFVQGRLQGRWERLIAEIGLQKDELEKIADQFFDRQIAYNEWRWNTAEKFKEAGDMLRAEAWRQNCCVLCDQPILVSGGQLICPCYREHGVGFVQYEPVDPVFHLKNWQQLGGVWGPNNKPVGPPAARQYASKTCYSNDCTMCGEPFYVTISEMLKVAKVIVEDPRAGGDGRYRVRRVCPNCKNGQKPAALPRGNPARPKQGEVKRLQPAAATHVAKAVGEKGG